LAKVTGPSGWSFQIDVEYRLIDNGDSVQAVAGDRVVYLSALHVDTPSGKPSAVQLRRVASRSLRSNQQISHVASGVEGDAEIRNEKGSVALHGYMCATGTVATCVISFLAPDDGVWAESVWRSLAYESDSV
jgi:hypothetical protein